jgi:hypothetical protein
LARKHHSRAEAEDVPDESETDATFERMLALYNSIPPGPDHLEQFLEKLHSPGWRERAMRVGPLTLEYGRRLLELEARVSRIERRLNPASKAVDWPKLASLEPLKPVRESE